MTKRSEKERVPRPLGRGTTRKGERKARRGAALPQISLDRIGASVRRNWAVVKGCLIFAVCIVAFMLIQSYALGGETLKSFYDFTATATGAIANLFGASATVDGSLISSPDFSMSIVFGCTGIVPIGIFVSAVLAYPCTARQKAAGIALGIVVLYALNLVRTVSLLFIGAHFSQSIFDTAHFLIWQPIMILTAIVLWLFWVERLVRVPNR